MVILTEEQVSSAEKGLWRREMEKARSFLG